MVVILFGESIGQESNFLHEFERDSIAFTEWGSFWPIPFLIGTVYNYDAHWERFVFSKGDIGALLPPDS